MNNQDNRLYEMYLHVQECQTVLAGKIPAGSYADELFGRLRQSLAQLDTHSREQSSNTRAVTESVASKDVTRKALRKKLLSIGRTAKPMDKKMPGVADRFRIPARLKDQDLLRLARAVAADVVPLKDEFVKRGLNASFPEDLLAAASDFEQDIGRKILNKESRVASNATVKRLLRECSDIVRELDPIIRNLFADDVAALALWDSASHVERTGHRTKANGQPTTPTPASSH